MSLFSLLLASGGMHAWAIATAAVVSAGAALVGTLLVVRRMSLLGDAIGHAVLPGIAIAMLAGGRSGGIGVFAGAVAAALATVWLTQALRSRAGLAEDAGAGVVFTTLFAIGVVIISAAAARIDVDPSCVLYGILEFVPFDTVSIGPSQLGPFEVPRAFLTGAAVLAGVSLAAALTWKMQVFTAFDPEAARAAGVPVGLCTTGLLAATAVSTVAGFEAVGAILVVAMLVVPAAAAELLVRRLHWMAVVAMLLAVLGSVVGYLAAWRYGTSAAGMIAVVLGLEYLVAVVVAPEEGLVARAVSRAWFAWRVGREDLLASVWRAEEATAAGRVPPPPRPAGVWTALARFWLARTGRIVAADGGWRLSPRGRAEAEVVVRSHRLWEAWLGRNVDLPSDHLHPPAEWVEHHLGVDVRTRLEADVGWQASDPHGRVIPPER